MCNKTEQWTKLRFPLPMTQGDFTNDERKWRERTPSTDTRCCDGSCCQACQGIINGSSYHPEICSNPSCPCHTEPKEVGLDSAIEQCIGVMGNKANQGSYAAPREAFRDILRETIAKEVEKEQERFLKLVTDEIATAHKEGTPTARLTSLYNQVRPHKLK